MASPCYGVGITGSLKSFLDHLAYIWMVHRPREHMFHKIGIAVSTTAGAGARKVTKDLAQQALGKACFFALVCHMRSDHGDKKGRLDNDYWEKMNWIVFASRQAASIGSIGGIDIRMKADKCGKIVLK